jgi:Cellulase (glycosyl hydrolase family 5)
MRVLAVTAALSACACSAHPAGPGSKQPVVQGIAKRAAGVIKAPAVASETSIVDAGGRKRRLVGVDDGRLDGGSGNNPDACGFVWHGIPSTEYANVAGWGFNTVRLAITWANLEPDPPTRSATGTLVHRWNETYLKAIDAAVAGFRARSVSVVLDMHQAGWSPAFKESQNIGVKCEGHGMPPWLYPNAAAESPAKAKCDFYVNRAEEGVPIGPRDGYVAAWVMVAKRYSSNGGVIGADLLNEPSPTVSCNKIPLQSFYETVGMAVQSYAPDWLAIVEDNAYTSYSTYGFALDALPRLKNVVYSWHFYPTTWRAGRPSMVAHVERAKSWNVPLWIGEFNAFNYGKGVDVDPAWAADTAAMMEYCKANNVGWSFWEYGRGSSLLIPGTSRPKSDLISILQAGF